MLDALLDAVLDSIKILPFLFVTYLIMEYLESHTEDRVRDLVKRAGWMAESGIWSKGQAGWVLSGAAFWVLSHNAGFQLPRQISMPVVRFLLERWLPFFSPLRMKCSQS